MMSLSRPFRIVLFGFLTWLVPFLVSIPFYTPGGEPLTDIFLLKSILIFVSVTFAAILIVLYFRTVKTGYLREGVILGIVWLFINWILDLAVLIPISGMSVADYFAQIGLRYLVIPVMTSSTGYLLQIKAAEV